MKLDELPAQFKPIKTVKLGSNQLENVTAILTVKGHVPLLIGDGEPARVWLYVPANKEGTKWYPVVKDNVASHGDVEIKKARKHMSIKVPEAVVLSFTRGGHDALVIHTLDLRPFGLDVYASNKELNVMGTRLSNNSFNGVRTVIGIGDT